MRTWGMPVLGLLLFLMAVPKLSTFAGECDESTKNVSSPTIDSEVVQQKTLSRERRAELIRSNHPSVAVAGYASQNIEGWPVLVSQKLSTEQPQKTGRAIELLAEQLRKVKDVLPAGPLAHIQDVPIWLSPKYEGVRPTGEYHPGIDWLKDQGRLLELHQCVELTNIEILEPEIQRMPMLMLHELAHAYHDQVLGFDHPEVKAAYLRVKESGIYDAVQRSNGRTEKAYAMTTPMEYFAECSEAFFGINDFYPFNSKELEKHDPEMFKLLGMLWNLPAAESK